MEKLLFKKKYKDEKNKLDIQIGEIALIEDKDLIKWLKENGVVEVIKSDIKMEDSELKLKNEKLKEQVELLVNENVQLKEQIIEGNKVDNLELKTENEELKKQISLLTDEIKQLKGQIKTLKKENEKQ